MESIAQRITVGFEYEVAFTRGLFEPDNPLFARATDDGADQPRRLLTVVDGGLLDHHPELIDQLCDYLAARCPHLEAAGRPMVVVGGEPAKCDPGLIEAVHARIESGGLDRHSFVCAIGGGAVLDMVGYAAATAHRGVRLVRVPTTVLSQNDSGVGVKNSVNAYGKKNFLGTFAPPWAVLNDLDFLATLDDRDWLGGISEAVKVALLKDPDFLDDLEDHAAGLVDRQPEPMARLVHRCAELHLDHIRTSGDPFEFGSSRPLDFGHWAAHRLESLTDYAVRHGEAVAVGICLDATYSHLDGRLDRARWRRVVDLFAALGLQTFHPALAAHLDDSDHPDSLLRGLAEFREHLGGELTVMLLEDRPDGAIGGVEVHHIDPEVVRRAVGRLQAIQPHPDAKETTCPPVPRPAL